MALVFFFNLPNIKVRELSLVNPNDLTGCSDNTTKPTFIGQMQVPELFHNTKGQLRLDKTVIKHGHHFGADVKGIHFFEEIQAFLYLLGDGICVSLKAQLAVKHCPQIFMVKFIYG